MHASFEIQHFTLLDGWVNTWSDSASNPVRFYTRTAAESELHDFFLDLQDEVDTGNIEPYDEREFRIVKVWLM